MHIRFVIDELAERRRWLDGRHDISITIALQIDLSDPKGRAKCCAAIARTKKNRKQNFIKFVIAGRQNGYEATSLRCRVDKSWAPQ